MIVVPLPCGRVGMSAVAMIAMLVAYVLRSMVYGAMTPSTLPQKAMPAPVHLAA